ncbi:hypothetical protein GIB67_016582 [Kingdonia uniflora]|uniref:DUF4283 domain-containing protein n=1 Tax=Kingdonia uniflora TaxID=39325 RepID=A0A7J7MZ48_9MAGN|nr:hypothetical protein GIB67_016582 [Kingdonia uniflora]
MELQHMLRWQRDKRGAAVHLNNSPPQKIPIQEARSKALDLWKLKGTCRLIPVGKGYITIFLDNEEDRNKIWSGGPWVIGKQLLRLSPWSPFFDPEKQKNTHALVWVKFPGLGVEFWEVDTLMALGRTLGTPIQINHSFATMDFRYFAKVLVDIDLAEPIPSKIVVEVEDGDFWQRVELGATPKFYSHCKIIGHTFAECRVIKEQVQRVEEPKTNQQEIPAPEAFTKNQKKCTRKKKQKEALNKGKGLLEGTEDTRAGVFDKMPHPIFDSEEPNAMPKQMSHEAPSTFQELESREATPVQHDALICNEQETTSTGGASTGGAEGEFLCPPPNSESSHQLLKETTIIKLQSALKWAYMVDDTEGDKALIAHEGVGHNLGKDFHVKLKKTTKQRNVGSGEGKGYPDTKQEIKKVSNEGDLLEYKRRGLGNLWCLWKAGSQDPALVAASSQHITIFYEGANLRNPQYGLYFRKKGSVEGYGKPCKFQSSLAGSRGLQLHSKLGREKWWYRASS